MAMIAMSSCSFSGDDNPSKGEEIQTIVELPDTVKQKIVEQDSLMTDLLNKVDTLTMELNSAKAENADLREKVAELKSPKSTWAYVSLGAFILGLIALITVIAKSKWMKKEGVKEIVKKYLDDYSVRLNKLQEDVKNLSSQRSNKNPQNSSSHAPNSDARIRILENQMAQVIAIVNQKSSSVPQADPAMYKSQSGRDYQKVLYAKVDTDIYFTTTYISCQEGCVFKITLTSENKGTFNIVALDKIQSRNDWQKKVVCIGASIKEASEFLIEEEGECERIDESTWKVTKPLKIKLK